MTTRAAGSDEGLVSICVSFWGHGCHFASRAPFLPLCEPRPPPPETNAAVYGLHCRLSHQENVPL